MHRTLTCVLAMCLIAGVARAQAPAQQASTTTATAPTADDALKALRADLQSSRADIMARNLTLTADQAAKFWPVFSAYQKEQNAIIDQGDRPLCDAIAFPAGASVATAGRFSSHAAGLSSYAGQLPPLQAECPPLPDNYPPVQDEDPPCRTKILSCGPKILSCGTKVVACGMNTLPCRRIVISAKTIVPSDKARTASSARFALSTIRLSSK
jgi:hypothetical protein